MSNEYECDGCGGDRNEACSEVRLLASKNKWISKY